MSISDWPLADQPQAKLLQKGGAALTDAELLAILLKTGTKGKTALDIAKSLLQEFGSLKKLLTLPKSLLLQQPGIGEGKYALLTASLELTKRCVHDVADTCLNSSQLTSQYLIRHLRDLAHECFACCYLDTKCRLLNFEILFHGTVNEATVYPRVILTRGLYHNAAKVILAHNHPSGDPAPSRADIDLTNLLNDTLAIIDIKLIDHIIIGNPTFYSFADNGLL